MGNSEHDEEEHAEGPDVAGGVVSLLAEDLRGHEVCRVAGRGQEAVLGPELLGEAEVADAQRVRVARLVGVKDVGWL